MKQKKLCMVFKAIIFQIFYPTKKKNNKNLNILFENVFNILLKRKTILANIPN